MGKSFQIKDYYTTCESSFVIVHVAYYTLGRPHNRYEIECPSTNPPFGVKICFFPSLIILWTHGHTISQLKYQVQDETDGELLKQVRLASQEVVVQK
ncbi:unnamed protein product, partial [Ranitomeya imitator]